MLKFYNLSFSLFSILVIKSTSGICSTWTFVGFLLLQYFSFYFTHIFLLSFFFFLSSRLCIWKNLGDNMRFRILLLSSKENLLLPLVCSEAWALAILHHLNSIGNWDDWNLGFTSSKDWSLPRVYFCAPMKPWEFTVCLSMLSPESYLLSLWPCESVKRLVFQLHWTYNKMLSFVTAWSNGNIF